MDAHRVDTQLAHEGRPDARDERVPAREHDDPTGADVVEDAPQGREQGRRPRHEAPARTDPEHREMPLTADDDLGLVDEPAAVGAEGLQPGRTHADHLDHSGDPSATIRGHSL